MYPFVVKATFWNDKEGSKEIHCLLYGDSMPAVAQRMEQYCDPEDLEIHCIGDELQLFEVSENIANILRLGCGIYADGLKIYLKEERK